MITSFQNKWIKLVRQLQSAKKRRKLQKYIIEGEHLIEEAINYQAKIEMILVTSNKKETLLDLIGEYPVEEVDERLFSEITETKTTQGILAIMRMQNSSLPKFMEGPILALDGIQDPGNLGTMIRTADAAGYSAVLLNKGTVDMYNGKVLRSMQGSQYHIPVYCVDFSIVLDQLSEQNYEIYATALDEKAQSYLNINPSNNHVVIFGNEGNGVSQEILNKYKTVYIPMPGQAESLNVAVATGIVLFRWL